MLKFFRQLRQELIAKNRFSKYLLYATGEILLVMIGILLALQVNNWNESRKNRKVEKEMLINIKEALETDIKTTINQNIMGLEGRAMVTRALINTAFKELPYPDSLQQHFVRLSYYREFTPIITPYKILESKGLDIIRKEELKKAIVDLYNLDYGVIHSRFDNDANNLRDIYRPLIRRHFRMIPNEEDEERVIFLPVDFNEMLLDKDFVNMIVIMDSNSKNQKSLLEALIPKIKEVVAAIDEEI